MISHLERRGSVGHVPGNDHDSQARTIPETGRGNPGPSGPSVGGRDKEALWHRVHETLQDMARRVPATTCRPSSTSAYIERLALRRRCKNPGPDCRRLLQKAGGTRVLGRALCETTGGGAGPVGAQQRPRRPPRWIGGGTRRGGADRDQDGPPESWTDGGNGPKVDVPFPRRNTRLESRRGNLKRCTPGHDVEQQQGHTVAPPADAEPGDSFYMA